MAKPGLDPVRSEGSLRSPSSTATRSSDGRGSRSGGGSGGRGSTVDSGDATVATVDDLEGDVPVYSFVRSPVV